MEVFDDTFLPPGLERQGAARPHCPRCVWPYLHQVDGRHWLCESCGHCWHAERGGLRSVDPLTCPGCSTRPRFDCIGLLATEFPRFGAGTDTSGDAV